MLFSRLHLPVLGVVANEDLMADYVNHSEIAHQEQRSDGEEEYVSFRRLLLGKIPYINTLPLLWHIEARDFEL